jgi:hypothetical protein
VLRSVRVIPAPIGHEGARVPSGSDDLGPDFLMMAKRIEPRVLAEIDRMEKAGGLSRYFDFARMRAILSAGARLRGDRMGRDKVERSEVTRRCRSWWCESRECPYHLDAI